MTAQKDDRPFWQKLRDIKLGKITIDNEARQERKDDLAKWYEVQATAAPARCENCGDSLSSTIKFHPRAHICHIVKKAVDGSGCPSVATHPLNRWFGCKKCHDVYDGDDSEVISTMSVIPICRARLKVFYPLIAANEVRRVPEFLLLGPEVTSEELPVIQVHIKKQHATTNKRGKKPAVKRASKKNG